MFHRPRTPLLADKSAACQPLRMVLDTISIAHAVQRRTSDAASMLQYYREDTRHLFRFLRWPTGSIFGVLGQIPEFEMVIGPTGYPTALQVNTESGRGRSGFGYDPQMIVGLARFVFNTQSPTAQQTQRVLTVFVQRDLTMHWGYDFFVTEDVDLLTQRFLLQPQQDILIVTVREAMEIMDLYAKSRGAYFISSYYPCESSWFYYWCLFRARVPYYNVSNDILSAFASRFVYVLMSLDKMGIQYYSGANNDTMEETAYNFNYFVSLVSGIFDALAIYTRERLQLRFSGDNIPSRTSLSRTSGRDFLRALRQSDPGLGQHVDNYSDFIRLIYDMRDTVIHREGLQRMGFEYDGQNGERWVANFIEVSNQIGLTIRRCGDRNVPYDLITEWGVYPARAGISPAFCFIAPFRFAKAATTKLAEFSNKYLELLGFSSFAPSRPVSVNSDPLDYAMSLILSESLVSANL